MPSGPAPSSAPRRARPQRPNFLSRQFLRHSPLHRRRHSSTLETFPSSEQDHTPVPEDHSYSSSFLHRHRQRQRDPGPVQTPQPKPIYIYPGLLRIVRDTAIALDHQCPAVLYKCRDCSRSASIRAGGGEGGKTKEAFAGCERAGLEGADVDAIGQVDASAEGGVCASAEVKCPHQISCSICLEDFHSKDLVRKLPCNINHVFHSKCILDWFISHHRCPLCNEPVKNTTSQPVREERLTRREETRRTPSYLNRGEMFVRGSDVTRGHVQLHRPRAISYSQPRSRDYGVGDESNGRHLSLHESAPLGGEGAKKMTAQSDKVKRKSRGPRTYSYIVHDNVRMEMNPVIPA